ncbi:uncharacterized protein UDID_18916 [Ustilago sp. UG-2017a]|nr:uncharacterized protein UDID_18916 [Ustilago sp. UG-2017a]
MVYFWPLQAGQVRDSVSGLHSPKPLKTCLMPLPEMRLRIAAERTTIYWILSSLATAYFSQSKASRQLAFNGSNAEPATKTTPPTLTLTGPISKYIGSPIGLASQLPCQRTARHISYLGVKPRE